jgi:hypothetical protein
MKTKLKVQKPIEIDVSLKYKCTNKDCGFDHWLFLREAKTKNFKIVCDCGTIFKPKRIQNIEVVYAIKESVEKPVDNPEESGKMEDIECVSRAINMMISLGYSKKDAQDSVIFIFKNEHIFDPSVLVKKAVLHIGGI